MVYRRSQLDAASSESQDVGKEKPGRSDLYSNENLDRLELVRHSDERNLSRANREILYRWNPMIRLRIL